MEVSKGLSVIGVEEVFVNWIDSCRSNNTSSGYKRVIVDFFQMTINKSVEDVSREDLERLLPAVVERQYTKELLNKGYKQSTIISYLKIVGIFMRELEINEVYSGFNYQKLITKSLSNGRLRDDSVRRERMTISDYDECLNWLQNIKQFSKRYEYKRIGYVNVLKFMFVTGIRISATFENAKWSDIKRSEDFIGQQGWTAYVVDKGNRVTPKPISDEFYEELRSDMYKGNDDALIFDGLSKQGFATLLREFNEYAGRELTPHSIRVGAATKVYGLTKDLVLTQRFLGHQDPKETVKYIREEDRFNSGSSILSSEIDMSIVDDLSHEELLNIIKRRNDIAFSIVTECNRGFN